MPDRMAARWLDDRLDFPSVSEAERGGLLAVGGDLSTERLLLAYRSGIFPWPHDHLPLLWFSPDPRMILEPAAVHASRSLRARLRRGEDEVRFDTCFDAVMHGCATALRQEQDVGTWIDASMRAAYGHLHALGYAHSVEVFRAGRLAGGLYGVSLGAAFFGESMFSREPDASKIALVALARRLSAWDFAFIDCQLPTPHLFRMGARPWPRARYLDALDQALQRATHRGTWQNAAHAGADDPG